MCNGWEQHFLSVYAVHYRWIYTKAIFEFLQILTAFCHTLHILRPAKAPGFAYAWLELVSHRVFLGRLLVVTPQQKG